MLRQLAAVGLSVEDYYIERAENVDGTMPRARFVLTRGEGDAPCELDNLSRLVEAVRGFGSEGLELKRFKGLGEMNAEQLADTTMDPERRGLLKVIISNDADDPEQLEIDAREADRIFSILMGDDVEARREFIEANAANVKNLDI
jgi:DNA gyrase subunit B